MAAQLLRVPWSLFEREIDRVLEWRAFSLWVRAILQVQKSIPAIVRAAVEQRCPGFWAGRVAGQSLDELWTDIISWSEQSVFAELRVQGWIEAAYYYSGGDPRSEQAWRQWERSVELWTQSRPPEYPPFDEWWNAARCISLPLPKWTVEADARFCWSVLASATGDVDLFQQETLDLRHHAFLATHSIPRPADRVSVLEFRDALHRFLVEQSPASQRPGVAIPGHPRVIRIVAYFERCLDQAIASAGVEVPAFQVWLREADEFVMDS
jgi:hypothetical protein